MIGRDRDRLGRIDHMLDVDLLHFLVANGDDAVRVETANVAARNTGKDRVDLAAGHQLRLFDSALNRLHGRLDVHDHATLQTARGLRADADDFDAVVGGDLAHQRHHLGGADVQSDDELSVRFLRHVRCRSV